MRRPGSWAAGQVLKDSVAAELAAPGGRAGLRTGVDMRTHRLLSSALGSARSVEVAEAIVDVALPVFNPLNVKAAIAALCNLESACAPP